MTNVTNVILLPSASSMRDDPNSRSSAQTNLTQSLLLSVDPLSWGGLWDFPLLLFFLCLKLSVSRRSGDWLDERSGSLSLDDEVAARRGWNSMGFSFRRFARTSMLSSIAPIVSKSRGSVKSSGRSPSHVRKSLIAFLLRRYLWTEHKVKRVRGNVWKWKSTKRHYALRWSK